MALASLDDPFDLVVVGAGITGSGIALDAAQRGLSTLLVERDDVGAGTSSRSSKLIHGGLRYLKQMQFRITRLACRERDRMLSLSPHLVYPIRFLYPAYRGTARPVGRSTSGSGCTTGSPAAPSATPNSMPTSSPPSRPARRQRARSRPGLQ